VRLGGELSSVKRRRYINGKKIETAKNGTEGRFTNLKRERCAIKTRWKKCSKNTKKKKSAEKGVEKKNENTNRRSSDWRRMSLGRRGCDQWSLQLTRLRWPFAHSCTNQKKAHYQSSKIKNKNPRGRGAALRSFRLTKPGKMVHHRGNFYTNALIASGIRTFCECKRNMA